MPFFLDQNLEDDQQQKNNNPTQIQISGASPTTDNSGNMISSSPGSTNTGDTQKNLVTGSGYQNLDKYLNTNNAKDFGNQVQGKVQGEINNLSNAVSATSNASANIKDQNKTPTSDQVNKDIANPTGVDPSLFQGYLNQTYQGPTSPSDIPEYNTYANAAQKAQTSAKLLGTEPGRFTLLDSYFGKPNYSYGQKSLDNLLLQNDGLGSQSKGLQDQVALLKHQGDLAANNLQNTISNTAGQVEKSSQYARNAIGIDRSGQVIADPNATGYGAIGKQYSQVNDALSQANAGRLAHVSKLQSDLASGNITSDEAQLLGYSPGERLYNTDPNAYLTPGQNLSSNQVMTPEQQSYIRALSQLAGVTDTFANGDLQAQTNPYSFDAGRFQNDLSANDANYQRDLQNTYNNIASQFEQRRPDAPPNTEETTQQYLRNIIAGTEPVADDNGYTQNYLVNPFLSAKSALDSSYNVGRTLNIDGKNPYKKVRR